jgi:ABC-type Na+ transport system ATPase subunit NatA
MIKVKHMVKSFGANRPVEDISFSVGRGKCPDFWVPRASVKSTTLCITVGFYPPTSGSVTVGGFDIVVQPASSTGQPSQTRSQMP